MHPLQLADQLAQPIVLAGQLVALFDQPCLLGARGIALAPHRQHQSVQRRNVLGKGLWDRHEPENSTPLRHNGLSISR